MFWRGGMSPSGYWNRDGWYGRGPALGVDTECTGDVCVVIASRLDSAQAKAAYEKMKYATANKPECLGQGTPQDVSDRVAAKLEKVVLGIDSSAALTKSETDYLAKFEACVGTVPAGPQGASDAVAPAIPMKTILIGAGALAAIALIVGVAK
jgi:hypothetical protein